MDKEVEEAIFWGYLEHDLQELVSQSVLMLQRIDTWDEKFHDYSFIVFPAAKAYEGFLKRLFFDLGFVTKGEYEGKRIRIGKALNPQLYTGEIKNASRYKRLRRKLSVYDKLSEYCSGPELGNKLWDTWKECRNLLFHWYPNERNAITLQEAEARIDQIFDSMNSAFVECKIQTKSLP